MSFDLTSPITGADMPSLTTPTYTLSADQALESNQKAYVVSALGGTQTSVDTHSIENPFQLVASRPKTLKLPSAAILAAEGYVSNAASNEFKFITRKSVDINATGGKARMLIETRIVVPVGAVSSDPNNIEAGLSAHFGALWADGNPEVIDLITDGVL